jgi:hypothetical protein
MAIEHLPKEITGEFIAAAYEATTCQSDKEIFLEGPAQT